jgi:hypothetical protein
MDTRSWNALAKWAIMVVAFCIGHIAPVMAQEKTKIAGAFTVGYLTRDTLFVSDTEGHYLLLNKLSGFNKSTGEKPFMDNSTVVLWGYGDYIQGQGGPHQAYIQYKSTEGSVFFKAEGRTSRSAYEGSLTIIKGTGPYVNIKGTGTYTGSNLPGRLFLFEWKAEYVISQ